MRCSMGFKSYPERCSANRLKFDRQKDDVPPISLVTILVQRSIVIELIKGGREDSSI